MSKRIKTRYAGVYYREVVKDGAVLDKYYIIRFFNKNIHEYKEEGVGFHSEGITPSFANTKRNEIVRNIKRNEGHQSLQDERKALFEAKQKQDSKWTFDKLWTEYKEKYKTVNRKEYKGLATDESRYKKYVQPIIGGLGPAEVTSKHIDLIREASTRNNLAPQTQKNILEIVRRISSWATGENKCEGVQFKIKMPSVNNKINESLTKDEINNMLFVLEKYENRTVANIIKMALFSGMRKSEILNLKLEHCDFDRKIITIVNPKSGVDKKIPLNSGILQILEEQKQNVKCKSEYVFPNSQGKPYSDIRRHLNRYKQLAGLKDDFRPLHGLRQTFSSFVSEAVGIFNQRIVNTW